MTVPATPGRDPQPSDEEQTFAELVWKGHFPKAIAMLGAHPELASHTQALDLVTPMRVLGRMDELATMLRNRALAASEGSHAEAVKVLIEVGRFDEAVDVLRRHPLSCDSYVTQRLADLAIARHGVVPAVVGVLSYQCRGRREDLLSKPHQAQALCGSLTAAEPLIAAMSEDDQLAVLRVRAAGGDARARDWLDTVLLRRATDARLRSIDLLMDAMYQLRIGRDLGITPYSIEEWERDMAHAPTELRNAKLTTALHEIGFVPSIPGGDLPIPGFVIVGAHDRRLFREEFIDTVGETSEPMRRWRAPGYHWDVRDDHGRGGFFNATVNDQGEVEFFLGSGGVHPATPAGWRALVADLNTFAGHRSLHITLWRLPYEAG